MRLSIDLVSERESPEPADCSLPRSTVRNGIVSAQRYRRAVPGGIPAPFGGIGMPIIGYGRMTAYRANRCPNIRKFSELSLSSPESNWGKVDCSQLCRERRLVNLSLTLKLLPDRKNQSYMRLAGQYGFQIACAGYFDEYEADAP